MAQSIYCLTVVGQMLLAGTRGPFPLAAVRVLTLCRLLREHDPRWVAGAREHALTAPPPPPPVWNLNTFELAHKLTAHRGAVYCVSVRALLACLLRGQQCVSARRCRASAATAGRTTTPVSPPLLRCLAHTCTAVRVWDLRTFECVQVLKVPALPAGACCSRWRLRVTRPKSRPFARS